MASRAGSHGRPAEAAGRVPGRAHYPIRDGRFQDAASLSHLKKGIGLSLFFSSLVKLRPWHGRPRPGNGHRLCRNGRGRPAVYAG